MYRSSNGHIQTILFILILNLALISISPGRLDSQTKEISVQIIAYRTEFKQYEEIELQLNIKNLTSHPVKIPIPNWQETIKIHLADDNGNIIMPGVIVTPGPLNPTVDLPAYQLRTEPLDLGGYRNIPPTNYGIAGAKLGPGIYNIRVTFDSVNSNEVEFRITQPPPNELKVLDEMVTLLMGPNPESNITAAQMLLKEYPQSIYRMGIYLTTMKSSTASSGCI